MAQRNMEKQILKENLTEIIDTMAARSKLILTNK